MSDSYPSENERLISVKGVAAVKLWPAANATPSITQEPLHCVHTEILGSANLGTRNCVKPVPRVGKIHATPYSYISVFSRACISYAMQVGNLGGRFLANKISRHHHCQALLKAKRTLEIDRANHFAMKC